MISSIGLMIAGVIIGVIGFIIRAVFDQVVAKKIGFAILMIGIGIFIIGAIVFLIGLI